MMTPFEAIFFEAASRSIRQTAMMRHALHFLLVVAFVLFLGATSGRAGTETAPAAAMDPFAIADSEPGYWVPDPGDSPVVYVDPAPVYYYAPPYPYYYYPSYYPYYGYSGFYGGSRFGYGYRGYGYRNYGYGGYRGGFGGSFRAGVVIGGRGGVSVRAGFGGRR